MTRIIIGILSFLPLSVHHAIGSLVGTMLFRFDNRTRRITNTNLTLCFPDLTQQEHNSLLKLTLKENAKTLIESFWLWKHPKLSIQKCLGKIENKHLLDRANGNTKGTIFVTPHFGSWEFIGLLTASQSDLLILYAPPKSELIEALSCQGRSGTGGKVISTESLNLKSLIRHLKNGGSVGILPDQVPEGNGGEYSPFFGRLAYTSTLVSKLAIKLQCNIVYCYAIRSTSSDQYNAFYFDAPKEIFSDNILASVNSLNKSIENFVLDCPHQYIWGYKRFKKPAPSDSNPY